MTINRSKFRGSDILHLKFDRIKDEFNDLLRFYELMEREMKSETSHLSSLISETILFDSVGDEDLFYSMIDSELNTFNDYFPQVSKNFLFISMFGLFENYLKVFVLISRSRKQCKSISDHKLQKSKTSELKTTINHTPLHKLKTDFINENKSDNTNTETVDNLWFELSKLKELRNSMIHNDSDVTKDIEKIWRGSNPQIHTLEQFIKEFFNNELVISENHFHIKNKEFLQRCKLLYVNFLYEMKQIITNHNP